MKSNVFTSALIALFLFAINSWTVKADSDAILYHNVEKHDNIISTTYFKVNGPNENLTPFKKKVNIMNEQNQCVSKTTYIWNSVAGNWTPSDKLEYTYNGKKIANVSLYDWNNKKSNWNNPQQVSYNYNENGLLTK